MSQLLLSILRDVQESVIVLEKQAAPKVESIYPTADLSISATVSTPVHGNGGQSMDDLSVLISEVTTDASTPTLSASNVNWSRSYLASQLRRVDFDILPKVCICFICDVLFTKLNKNYVIFGCCLCLFLLANMIMQA